MLRVSGIDQLFMHRSDDGSIGLMEAKVIDGFFISGTTSSMEDFLNHLDSKFNLGASSIGNNLRFLGCQIEVYADAPEKLCARISMYNYLRRVRRVRISKDRKTSPNRPAHDRERSEYRSLAGTLLYVGQSVLPQACFVASKVQQRLGLLKVGHLSVSNSILAEMKKREPRLFFRLQRGINELTIYTGVRDVLRRIPW